MKMRKHKDVDSDLISQQSVVTMKTTVLKPERQPQVTHSFYTLFCFCKCSHTQFSPGCYQTRRGNKDS